MLEVGLRVPPARRLFAVATLLLSALLLAAPALAQDSETVIFGTVRAPGDATAEGITVTVAQDGEQVGEATADAEGRWEVPVPEGGTYTVSIVPETLPEGVVVREGDRFATQEVTVEEGKRRAILFPLELGEGGLGPVSFQTLKRVVSLTFSGLQLGAIIAITSLGLSLIFGITGLVNFAHGEMVTFGAVVALFLNAPPGLSLHILLAGLIAVAAGAGLGFVFETGLFGPLRRRRVGNVALLVISIGLSILLRYGTLMVYGGQSRPYRQYTVQSGLQLGPITTTPKGLWVTVVSLAVLAIVGVLLVRTKLGTAMRAVADNRDLAESSGINVQRIILATWIAGGALAAFGGVAQGLIQAVTWDMGFALLLLMFAGVILGGLGTAFGAMVGGLAVGIVTQVSTVWFSVDLKLVFAFGVLIVVLLVRPQGILGRRERVG